MLEKLTEILVEELGVDAADVTETASLTADLGADSLALFELTMKLEDEYGVEIPEEDLPKLQTVGNILTYLQEKGVNA